MAEREREKEGEWVSDDYRNDVNDDEDFAWLQGERREAFSSPPLSLAIRSGHLYLFREGRRKQWPDHNGLFTMNWNSCKFHPRPPSFELGIRVLRARWLGRSTIFQDLLRDERISFYLLFLYFFIYILFFLFRGWKLWVWNYFKFLPFEGNFIFEIHWSVSFYFLYIILSLSFGDESEIFLNFFVEASQFFG